MHKDSFTTTVPDISHIVKNINDLMCCGNCVYGASYDRPQCIDHLKNEYCDEWRWDKQVREDRIEQAINI